MKNLCDGTRIFKIVFHNIPVESVATFLAGFFFTS